MLTEVACKAAAPREREYKLTDAGNLFLRVKPSGHKAWCWKYLYAGREKRLTIGTYPSISLKEARRRRDRAREKLEEGIDPGLEKKLAKLVIISEALNTFEAAARVWHVEQSATLSPRYASQILDRLENHVFPLIGPMPIRAITAQHVLAVIRRIEDRGTYEMAHRVRVHMSDIFTWALACGLADTDPAEVIKKALKPTDPKLRPALVQIGKARQVLIQTEAMKGASISTLLASRLLALTAARPGVVRLAEKREFEKLDGDKPIWRIPAAKMKLTRQQKRDITWEFVIPLSPQAVAVVKAAIAAAGSQSSYLFPGANGWRRPISDSTLSGLYRNAGLRGKHVPHGWRSSFSTILNELAAVENRPADRAIIDLMLAHTQSGTEPVYNRAAYMPRRREIMLLWADMLMQGMPPPDTLLPPALRQRAEVGHDELDLRRTAIRGTRGQAGQEVALAEVTGQI